MGFCTQGINDQNTRGLKNINLRPGEEKFCVLDFYFEMDNNTVGSALLKVWNDKWEKGSKSAIWLHFFSLIHQMQCILLYEVSTSLFSLLVIPFIIFWPIGIPKEYFV